MSVLMDLIQTQLNDSHYQSLGQTIGANPVETKSAVNEALPVLLGALSNKATTNTGLSFLTSMLDKNHDGSIFDDLIGMVTGTGTSPQGSIAPQNAAAVNSLLGDNVGVAEEHIAKNSGMDAATVAKLLPLLAPIVIGALSKTQSSQDLSGKGLQSFLEKEHTSIAQNQPQAGDFLSSMIDKNKDGSIVDDLMKMAMGALGGTSQK